MSHLPTERLAALVDETPSADESAHLATCDRCAREREAYRAVTSLASVASTQIGAALTSWEALRPALVADGVIDVGGGRPFRARSQSHPWMQAAAALILVTGGMIAGRYTAGAPPFAAGKAQPTAAQIAPGGDSTPHFASIEEARMARERYQMWYQTATAFIAQRDTAVSSTAAKRIRLSALDRANQVFSAAMTEAPNDPVITGSYLTTLGQREATLRQLNSVAPASMRMQSY